MFLWFNQNTSILIAIGLCVQPQLVPISFDITWMMWLRCNFEKHTNAAGDEVVCLYACVCMYAGREMIVSVHAYMLYAYVPV